MWEYVRLHLTQITVDIKDCYTAACVGEFCVAIWCISHEWALFWLALPFNVKRNDVCPGPN